MTGLEILEGRHAMDILLAIEDAGGQTIARTLTEDLKSSPRTVRERLLALRSDGLIDIDFESRLYNRQYISLTAKGRALIPAIRSIKTILELDL